MVAEAVKKAKAAMEAAQQRQKAYADAKRRDVDYTVGQQVLLSTTNIRPKFKGSPKLLPKWIGPYEITEIINPVAFRLKLPETLKLHTVLHASLLKPYRLDGRLQPPPPPEMVDGEWDYEVESVLSHRFKRGNKLEYLVQWTGFGHEHDTWEPEEHCATCAELVTEYWDRFKMQTEKKPVSKRKVKRKRQEAQLSGPTATRTSSRRRCTGYSAEYVYG
jgi:hypothetical protein